MNGLETLGVVLTVVLVVIAALLAAAETAITRLSTARAEALVEEGARGARTLRLLLDEPQRYLNPVLFVLLGCHLGAAMLVAILADRWWGAPWVPAAVAVLLVAVYLLAEALPKNLALASLDRTALRLAPLVRVLSLIAPLRWVASGAVGIARRLAPPRDESEPEVSEEELLAFADEAAAAEAIEPEEQVFIRSVIEFGDTVVRSVMVPRPDIVALPVDAGVGEAIRVVLERGYSRLPLYSDGIDDVVGVVYARDLMRHQAEGRADDALVGLAREARFVPDTKRIAVLMREMQAESFHIAVVIDEYGGTAGLVTLEDLIEELVGEIVDEFDVEEPMIEPLGEGRVRVNGRAPLDDVQELLGTELPQGEWSTVGGLIFNSLGHVPSIGESVEVGQNRFLVERVHGRRIARVQIVPVERELADQAGAS